MKVVINGCHGGFGLSAEATLRLHELGAEIATPVSEYWRNGDEDGPFGRQTKLEEWRAYRTAPGARESVFLIVFSPDERLVLNASKIRRDDPRLLQVIGEMGERANGRCARLKIVEVPDGVEWDIEEYDGSEWVAEKHRTWR